MLSSTPPHQVDVQLCWSVPMSVLCRRWQEGQAAEKLGCALGQPSFRQRTAGLQSVWTRSRQAWSGEVGWVASDQNHLSGLEPHHSDERRNVSSASMRLGA